MVVSHRIILASTSPRRRYLLGLGGWEFTTVSAEVDENPLVGEDPVAYVKRLSQAKARQGWQNSSHPGAAVVGADTTVIAAGRILGKPVDDAEAFAMLAELRNRVHEVVTAVTVVDARGNSRTEVCATEVGMRDYTDAEIQDYIATGDPLDKAGAYAIQHAGFHPAEFTRGCFANVVGLPVCLLAQMLREVEVPDPARIHLSPPASAEDSLHCPVCKNLRNETG